MDFPAIFQAGKNPWKIPGPSGSTTGTALPGATMGWNYLNLPSHSKATLRRTETPEISHGFFPESLEIFQDGTGKDIFHFSRILENFIPSPADIHVTT